MAGRLQLVADHIAPKRSFFVGEANPADFDLKLALVCMQDVRAQEGNLTLETFEAPAATEELPNGG